MDPNRLNGAVAPTSTAQTSTGLVIHNRSGRHWMTCILQTCLRPFRPKAVKPGKISPADSQKLQPKRNAKKKCHIEERQVDGVWIYDMTSKTASSLRPANSDTWRRRILYFAGGGWQMPPSGSHWAFCAQLATRLKNTTVTLISYPLAPKTPVWDSFPQIERVYSTLLEESASRGERVVVAGDSSGGNIALCLTTWNLNKPDASSHAPLPVSVLAICPTTDLSHQNPDILKADKVDPIMSVGSINETSRAWCPETREGSEKPWTLEDPRVSPIQADLSSIIDHNIKIHGVVGSRDVLAPEATVFIDRCQKEGIGGEWLHWEGQMHCFPIAFNYGLRESKQAVDWIVGVLQKD